MAELTTETPSIIQDSSPSLRSRLNRVPWWFVAVILIGVWAIILFITDVEFGEAFNFIKRGLLITIRVSLIAYSISLVLGLLAGMGRISKSVVLNNIATFYVEIIRGIPMLVLIFYIALVGVPMFTELFNKLGALMVNAGVLANFGEALSKIENQGVPMEARAIIALAVTYGAFLAEIFRAGIQSIGKGQMEAARSLGMSYAQAMRYIILPQAIRNVLPALGNDFVAMLKDSSLVSVLAVRDITQVARLYAGSSFRFHEAYTTLAVMYLTMTVILSSLIRVLERRMQTND